jgi:hypothetical protein
MNDEMISFLIRAKKATYAGHGAESTPSRPASHDLVYQEGDLTYIDTYLGGERFSGEEALWQNGQPIWAMNYTGRTVHQPFSGDFLKEALSHGTQDKPYRGPEYYADGTYEYTMNVEGDISWHQGSEKIMAGGRLVYELFFHGGLVQ